MFFPEPATQIRRRLECSNGLENKIRPYVFRGSHRRGPLDIQSLKTPAPKKTHGRCIIIGLDAVLWFDGAGGETKVPLYVVPWI